MITKTFKTTTGKRTVTIPTELYELTLNTMIALQEQSQLNDIEAISILSGVPVSELSNVISMEQLQYFTAPVLSLLNQIANLYNSDCIPQKINFTINGKVVTVKVMNNLAIEPAGAFMAARDLIAENISEHIKLYGQDQWQQHYNPSLNVCSQVLAHYFYCKATGKPYNDYAAEEFVNEIKKLRVTEALPIAKHFFTCYPHLSKPRASFWHRFLPSLKNVRASRLLKSLNTSTL